MLVSRIMREPVAIITPQTTVPAAAALMARRNVGALLVCDGGRPEGILTDRDIVLRWVARARDGDCVAPIMSRGVVTCRADQSVEDAAHLMGDLQIRRLAVLDAGGHVVGILTLGDIANDASEELAGQTLGEIVETR